MLFPINDREGTVRPYIVIKPDCTAGHLFEEVCFIRGKYDLARALDGLDPFNWGNVGEFSDVHTMISSIKSMAGSR